MGTCQRFMPVAVAAVLGTLIAAGLAPAQLPVVDPAPAPERARLAFLAGPNLFTVAADGSARTKVADDAMQPAWSPTRGSIAFVRYGEEDDLGTAQIWTVAPDGGGARALTPRREETIDSAPAWSPDGRRIAFVRVTFTEVRVISTIVSAAAEGGDEKRVARLTSTEFETFSHLAWSPDGASLLVTRASMEEEPEDDGRPEIDRVDVASGRRTRLLRNARDAAWAPDGGRFAYVGVRPSCRTFICDELYLANADGGGRRRLTTDSAADTSPSWSADGQRIAFASTRNQLLGESPEIYSVKPDGTCLTWLTNGTADSVDPSWEPGAALSTDAGGCGAVAREPLIETDTSEVATYRRAPVWWLGPRFGNLLLDGASVEDGIVFLEYGDCAAFDPSECPPPFNLDTVGVCIDPVLRDADPRRLARHEGAIVARSRFPEEDHPWIYTGPSAVAYEGIEGNEPVPASVLGAMRRFGEDAPPADGLPLAQIPLRVWRTLERTSAVVRKYGSVAAAKRRLRLSATTIRQRLGVLRELRRLGPFGRHDCGRG